MKRFNKTVEEILLGKYGIEYKNGRYCQVRHANCQVRNTINYTFVEHIQYEQPCEKYITLFELLGILEYEYLYVSIKMRNCNCFSLCFNCYKNKDVQYALTEAKNIVICEIERIQKGG